MDKIKELNELIYQIDNPYADLVELIDYICKKNESILHATFEYLKLYPETTDSELFEFVLYDMKGLDELEDS